MAQRELEVMTLQGGSNSMNGMQAKGETVGLCLVTSSSGFAKNRSLFD